MNPTQNYNILIVDDIADNLVLMKLLLEIEGYQVDVASSGSTAISKIEASPPDLVLLDVMMPDMSGLEVTQRLRGSKSFSLLPIVLITADRAIDFEQARAAGANDLICKPVDMDELLIRIGNLCQ
ncbi:MAG: response regulator [Stenomitos rutilans HA7619-LM2]|jgi:CheY-like chemotaxis protein|nr:response regulator [Stenomitos rutilans HA7619-LM2]